MAEAEDDGSEGYFGGTDRIPAFDRNGNISSNQGDPFDRISWTVTQRAFPKNKESTIAWHKRWQLVESTDFECGQGDPEFETSWSVGSEKTTKKTLDANLSLLLPPIHAVAVGVGLSRSVQDTFSQTTASTKTITRKFKEIPCKRLSVALWQLVHVLEVSGPHAKLFSGTSIASPQVGSTSIAFRTFTAYDSRCCPEPTPQSRYYVKFPTGSEELKVIGRSKDGLVLDGVTGTYKSGDAIPLTAFKSYRDWLAVPEGKSFTYGVLNKRLSEYDFGSSLSRMLGRADVDHVVGTYISGATNAQIGRLFDSEDASRLVIKLKRDANAGWLTASGTIGNLSEVAGLSLAAPITSFISQRAILNPDNFIRIPQVKPQLSRTIGPATAKKAPARKAAAKKAPTRKAAAKKAPARKAAAKKAPSRKTAAKR